MSRNVKSASAAAQLNDLFAKLSLRGVYAWPTDAAESVLVQYHSDQHGRTRTVSCEPRALMYWLNERALSGGWRAKFSAILDRKEERDEAVKQAELNLEGSPPIVKRSLRDE